MVSKRRPININATPSPTTTRLNFRPNGFDPQRNDTKGTRPTATPTTVKEVLLMMIVHVCKKTIFFDVNLKVAVYLGSLFLISLIGDFTPYPRTYFARSDNLFNVYFVKMGWAWTLALSVPFMVMTSRVLCAGDTNRLITQHLPRILIATGFWFGWTKLFNIVEHVYGRCNARGFDAKSPCLKAGHFWNGFDISGHVFILIYSSLVLIEEARPIVGWEHIKEHLRNEEHARSSNEKSSTNPLRNLKDRELQIVKELYEKYTPKIRLLFIGIAVLQLLWDVMLVCTMLYYHKMIEKVISGIIAILTWFFTYRAWFPSRSVLPVIAGQGIFNYQKGKGASLPLRKQSLVCNHSSLNSASASRVNDVPKFMGMPLYAAQASVKTNVDASWK